MLIILLLYGLLFPPAVSSTEKHIEEKGHDLLGTVWRLESFEAIGQEIEIIQDGRIYSINFGRDTVAHIRADCNWCNGKYRILMHENLIAWGLMGCSEVGCGPASFGDRFTRALWNISGFTVFGDLLQVYYDGNTRILNMRAQKKPQRSRPIR